MTGDSMNKAEEYLNTVSISYRTVYLDHAVHTALDVARLCRCKIESVVKSLVFFSDAGYVLVAIAGNARVSSQKLKHVIGAVKIRMANARETEAQTGYQLGTVGPFGVSVLNRIIYDTSLFHDSSELFFGSGKPDMLIAVRSDDLRKLVSFQVADLAE